jgi:pimeloyl-ACP methyl ester carboxylesterase
MILDWRFTRILGEILTSLVAVLLIGSIPAGAVQYDIKPISDNSYNTSQHFINNNGDIVFGSMINGTCSGVYLYKADSTPPITPIKTTASYNSPIIHINNNGDILWREYGGLYLNGNVLSIDSLWGDASCINDNRQIVFTKYDEQFNLSLCLYDNGNIIPIVNNSNRSGLESVDINNNKQVVFINYDGHGNQVYLYENGTPVKLTNYDLGEIYGAGSVKINNKGQIIWTEFIDNTGVGNIVLWEGGAQKNILNGISNLHEIRLNDLGQLVYQVRPIAGESDIFNIYTLYTNIPNDVPQLVTSHGYYPAINNNGQIAYNSHYPDGIYRVYRASPKVDTPYAKYYFNYHYNDGNGDYFCGYVIDATGLASVGDILKGTTRPLGRTTIRGNGYYKITSISDFNGSSYDIGKCYVTTYYDGFSKKSSQLFSNSNGGAKAKELYVGQKGLGLEKGYVIRGMYYAFNPTRQVTFGFTTQDCQLITPEDFVDITGDESYAFDPNRASVILVHGWNTREGEDDLWDWVSKTLKKDNDYYRIATNLFGKSNKNANLFIWDWKSLAYSSLIDGPPTYNEKLSSQCLVDLLKRYFKGTATAQIQNVQFIGHSMGSKISLLSARALRKNKILKVAQVTLLDPFNCEDIVDNYTYKFYIDHYASFVSRFPQSVPLPGWEIANYFVLGATINVYLADVKLENICDLPRCHHEAINWYLNTIQYPDKYGKAGYYWSITNKNGERLLPGNTPAYYFSSMSYEIYNEVPYALYLEKAWADYVVDVVHLDIGLYPCIPGL